VAQLSSRNVTRRLVVQLAEYQQLMDVRSIAMDVRFGLLDGLLAPTPTDEKKESE